MLFRIMLVVTGITGGVMADSACCAAGQPMLTRRGSSPSCWEPVMNVTTPLSVACTNVYTLIANNDTRFEVNNAGKLLLGFQNVNEELEPGTFCIGNATSYKKPNASKTKNVVVLCYEEEYKVFAEEIFGICMIVSLVFLFLTALIYTALPELRDLQGKSIINFCLSLGIGLGVLAAMKLLPYSDMKLCAARGFFAYFFIIASFFWANAISIQILLNMRRPSVNDYGWKYFRRYALYAWSCPAVLTIVMAIINFVPGDHAKPGIGLNHCWFYNTKQQWRYMYSVMTILIAINICIFIYTSQVLWRHTFTSSHTRALRYKFVMTIHLFIVMGVSWSSEMIGSLVKSHIIWEILDLINCLQGVLIFIVLVVTRRRVLRMLVRHGWLPCLATPLQRYLAVHGDDEDAAQHTAGLSLDEPNGKPELSQL